MIEQFFGRFDAAGIDSTLLPPQYIKRNELGRRAAAVVDADQHAAFGSGFANMPALKVTGVNDQRLFVANGASVNMSQ